MEDFFLDVLCSGTQRNKFVSLNSLQKGHISIFKTCLCLTLEKFHARIIMNFLGKMYKYFQSIILELENYTGTGPGSFFIAVLEVPREYKNQFSSVNNFFFINVLDSLIRIQTVVFTFYTKIIHRRWIFY